jgi:Asp-tRNA(Asn)/Glu-tRNA(Gln) amidotransferase C subunit
MPRNFQGDALDRALSTARLTVPPERIETVRETAESIYTVIDQLDSLDLGETPPAAAFNARWE